MEESSPNRRWRHLARWDWPRAESASHLRKWFNEQGRSVSGEFFRGVAYKFGSGTVTLIILWSEARH
ncbi:hypothetical protein [Streptomyces lydicus]|uniref:hypothetical protein n=1 Tax=Streptomyces lydicus TaxID=47763 RepID=UPI0036E59CF4